MMSYATIKDFHQIPTVIHNEKFDIHPFFFFFLFIILHFMSLVTVFSLLSF